jgi:hypothetical protein
MHSSSESWDSQSSDYEDYNTLEYEPRSLLESNQCSGGT